MRTLHVFESISIDGYFIDQNSDLGWARASREDPEFGSWMGKNASRRADPISRPGSPIAGRLRARRCSL